MAQVPRGIGWSQESNLLYQILNQLNKLTSVLFGLKPKYKVYTALLTQSGGDNSETFSSGDLTIGETYQIVDGGGYVLGDFTNVGAPNNDFGTWFVATGTTPNSWGNGVALFRNLGAPVVTVLENTIGNIWFTYSDIGEYFINSNSLFTINKTFIVVVAGTTGRPNVLVVYENNNNDSNIVLYSTRGGNSLNDELLNTSIEIRVYN